MKNIKSFFTCFLPENFRFLEVKFSIYLNRRVFVMNVRVKHNGTCAGRWLLGILPRFFVVVFFVLFTVWLVFYCFIIH